MSGIELSIYLDDSGQLHPNYYSSFFVYGGYWCIKGDEQQIANCYARMIRQIYRTKREIKASEMKHKQKRKILRRLATNFKDTFHPIFVASNVDDITIDFKNKENVQLHKNYLIRRLVEDVIHQARDLKIGKIEKVSVFIDNQNQTKLTGRDSLSVYMNKKFRPGSYVSDTYTISEAAFECLFLDSKAHRTIQIADLLANCKFNRFENHCVDLQVILDNLPDVRCRKHPKYFSSGTKNIC